MVEVAADAGGDLCDALDLRQAIEARHQRVVQGRRHAEARLGSAGAPRAVLRLPGQLHEGPRQLFDEQRHAVGPGQDLAADRLRQGVAAFDGGRHRLDGGASQAVERQARHVRMARQHGLAVRPAGQQEKDALAFDPVEHEMDEFQGRRIGPVHVLHHHQHGPPLRQAEELLDQRLERLIALGLRREIERDRSGCRKARRAGSRPAEAALSMRVALASGEIRRSCRAASPADLRPTF